MNEDDLEGTLILEKLALINKVDAFFQAVDSDNFNEVKKLMKQAQVDSDSIATVLKMMSDGE